MKIYYLQEKIKGKWITQAESNSREWLTESTVLEFSDSETRIVPASEVHR